MFEKMAPDAHLSYANDNAPSSKLTNPIEIIVIKKTATYKKMFYKN